MGKEASRTAEPWLRQSRETGHYGRGRIVKRVTCRERKRR
jgi:hypothetical protein